MTKQEIEKEIEELRRVVTKVGHKYGGRHLMKIAALMRELQAK